MGFLPGAIIGGKYRLERKIAEGGVGEVWIGVDKTDRRVAIKRLLPETAKDRELQARFRREAVLLGKIQSEHVSAVIEQITDPALGLLLVMEFVDGESLADMLDRRRKIPVVEVIDIGIDIARAIAVLHEANIIHRDLKPENLILRRLPTGGTKPVLIDFGFARLDPHGTAKRPNDEALTGITRADTMLGTIAYMAPEQVLNSRDVGRPADIYALGAMLYRAMTGRHVFGDLDDIAYARAKLDGEAPPLAIDRVSATAVAIAKVIMRAIRRRPADRFESIEAMRKELSAVRETARTSEDVDAPTQAAPISSLLGADAANIIKVNEGGTAKTDRVVFAGPNAPEPPTAKPTDDSGVTRPHQVTLRQTSPMSAASEALPMAAPPLPPATAVPPSMRLAPPPVPPKMPPPGVHDDLPAFLRNTGRAVAMPPISTPTPGVPDELPAHLRNTARNPRMAAIQPSPPVVQTPRKVSSSHVSYRVALASMLITLIAGFAAGWIMHASLSGHSPLEVPVLRAR
jgi:serine/threonine protein kinase